MKILHVEDDAGNHYFAARVLEADGHEVVRAVDGAATLAALAEWRPDLIILDIELPDMDGFELVERARSLGLVDGIPIVALTGWGGPGERARASREGFAAFLEKPLRLAELRRAVARVLAAGAPRESGLGGMGC